MAEPFSGEGCALCPRACGASRGEGERGFCGAGSVMRIAYADLHFWEEPPISGTTGSGAVFFSHCALRCAFCQNHEISAGGKGRRVSPQRLGEIFLELQDKGAVNINLVTASHYAPLVAASVRAARRDGLWIPVVWNSGGYETAETLRLVEDVADVYLPDFKFWNDETARLLAGAPDYRRRAKAAIAEMVRQKGTRRLSASGIMLSGVLVRHLMLPGRLSETKKILSYLFAAYGDDVYVSLMRQYTPLFSFPERPELERRVTDEEYERAVDFAAGLGMRNLFLQAGESAREEFIPRFEGD